MYICKINIKDGEKEEEGEYIYHHHETALVLIFLSSSPSMTHTLSRPVIVLVS